MFISNGDSISARTVYDSDLSLFYVIPMLLLLSLLVASMLGTTSPRIKGEVWAFNQVKREIERHGGIILL